MEEAADARAVDTVYKAGVAGDRAKQEDLTEYAEIGEGGLEVQPEEWEGVGEDNMTLLDGNTRTKMRGVGEAPIVIYEQGAEVSEGTEVVNNTL